MIRLHSLRMNHFRGVREGVVEALTDVNLLIGRNNSGKTTVVEAIMRLFLQGRNESDVLGRSLHEVGIRIRDERNLTPPTLWYRQDQTQPVHIEGTIGESKFAPTKDCNVSLSIETSRGTTPAVSSVEGSIGQAQLGPFLHSIASFRSPDALRNIEQQYWPQLLVTRRDKALTKTLNDIFGLQAEGFHLLPDNRLMVLYDDYSLPLDVQGDGTRAALRTLIVLTLIKQGVFLLEEPECHQHPGSLERFARAVCALAREQEVQLIISTHSLECVQTFLKGAAAAGSEGAVFHLTLGNGRQNARRLDADAVETLQSTGVDVRFLDLYG